MRFNLRELSWFTVVGIAATLTYFVVANAIMLGLRVDAAWASVIGYLAGMVVSFLGQSRLTFQIEHAQRRHIVRFLAVSALGLLISYGSVILVRDGLHLPAFWATVATMVAVPLASFLMMKFWVFVR